MSKSHSTIDNDNAFSYIKISQSKVSLLLELPSPLSFEHIPHIPSHMHFTTESYSLPASTSDYSKSRTSIDLIRDMTHSSSLKQDSANITVLDVYDEAALIGKDFERIIEGKFDLLIIAKNDEFVFK